MLKVPKKKKDTTNKEKPKSLGNLLKNKETTTEPIKDDNTPKYDSLRDIMDYKRPFTMFFSGVEYKTYLDIVHEEGVKAFLMSYEYAKTKGASHMKEYAQMGLKIFIDSGAFTFMQDPKYSEYTIEQWEKHIESYLKWARKHKDVIFAIANMDLEMIVGEEQVRIWNEKYFEPFMLETGIPVCFIWHTISEETGWEYYCKRYPYVGFSWVSDTDGVDLDFNYGLRMLKVAEKYNTLVHGMGMTRTSILPKLPFYTVDSTSWKAGLRYGLFSIWTDNKVKQVKKEEWDTKVVPSMNQYDREFDMEKLHDYDMEEVIRASVYAYILAERYIIDRLKSKMYWLKAKVKNQKAEDINYPSLDELLDADRDTLKQYAELLNINPELEDLTTLRNYVCDCVLFNNWDNEDYSELRDNYTSEVIKELHDTFVNRVVATEEERIEDLKKFYKDTVEGNETVLLYIGTNFDRMVKERDFYIEEDNFDYVDVDKNDVLKEIEVLGLLPSNSKDTEEAPEITELDEEIFRQTGIEPVRDSKGRFLKGQRKVTKPKKIYSDKYPKMACDTCYASATCPQYKAGYACAYNKMFKRFDTRNMGDIVEAMQSMIGLNLERMQKLALFETLDGGIPRGDLTQMINQNMNLLSNLKNMYEMGGSEVVKHTVRTNADGSREETLSVNNTNGSSGGILNQLFAKLGRDNEDKKDNSQEEPSNIIVDVEESK